MIERWYQSEIFTGYLYCVLQHFCKVLKKFKYHVTSDVILSFLWYLRFWRSNWPYFLEDLALDDNYYVIFLFRCGKWDKKILEQSLYFLFISRTDPNYQFLQNVEFWDILALHAVAQKLLKPPNYQNIFLGREFEGLQGIYVLGDNFPVNFTIFYNFTIFVDLALYNLKLFVIFGTSFATKD